jgi:hypothetical protein
VTVSIVFIYECIASRAILNRCIGINHIFLVIEGICKSELMSTYFILINFSETEPMTSLKSKCRSLMSAVVSI